MDLERLEQLTLVFRVAKLREEESRKERITIEKQIAELISTGDTSSKTVTLLSGWKITVKRGLIYKADLVEISRLCAKNDMPSPIKIKTTREFDAKGYEWLRKMEPDFFPLLANRVTVTPRKVGITLKEPT